MATRRGQDLDSPAPHPHPWDVHPACLPHSPRLPKDTALRERQGVETIWKAGG